jgi:outer membrane lipoprotein-sorting protein
MTFSAGALCALLCCGTVFADSVSAVLSRMDETAPQFHGATADVVMDTYEAILSDHTKENGTLQMQRNGAADVRAIVAFTGGNDARTISFKGKTVRIYYPRLNTYQEADMGNKSQVLNHFLLLGFGSSGKELAAAYDVSSGGTESIGGTSTTKLVLVPKDAETKKTLDKVEIWIPEGQAYPLQQKFYQHNGNIQTVTYTNVKINPPMARSLEFKMPPGAAKQQ